MMQLQHFLIVSLSLASGIEAIETLDGIAKATKNGLVFGSGTCKENSCIAKLSGKKLAGLDCTAGQCSNENGICHFFLRIADSKADPTVICQKGQPSMGPQRPASTIIRRPIGVNVNDLRRPRLKSGRSTLIDRSPTVNRRARPPRPPRPPQSPPKPPQSPPKPPPAPPVSPRPSSVPLPTFIPPPPGLPVGPDRTSPDITEPPPGLPGGPEIPPPEVPELPPGLPGGPEIPPSPPASTPLPPGQPINPLREPIERLLDVLIPRLSSSSSPPAPAVTPPPAGDPASTQKGIFASFTLPAPGRERPPNLKEEIRRIQRSKSLAALPKPSSTTPIATSTAPIPRGSPGGESIVPDPEPVFAEPLRPISGPDSRPLAKNV